MLRSLGGDYFYFTWTASKTVFVLFCAEKRGRRAKSPGGDDRKMNCWRMVPNSYIIRSFGAWFLLQTHQTDQKGSEKCVSWYPIVFQMVFSFIFVFFPLTVIIIVAKINWIGLKDAAYSNMPGTIVLKQALRKSYWWSQPLRCGHIHVWGCVGEQVGETLPCPCCNLLDMSQCRLGRGTVPFLSQVTHIQTSYMGFTWSRAKALLLVWCGTSSGCGSEQMAL